MNGLAQAVTSGIFSPDEARASEDLPAVTGGHGAMPRVQQQVVPLSYGSDLKPPDLAKPEPPVPASNNEDNDDAGRGFDFTGQIDELTAKYASSVH